MRLIPAIDLRGGRCVRLLQGRFDAETIYAEDPSAVLSAYVGMGARYLHLVDLDAARGEPQVNRQAVESLARNRQAALQVGGGIRSRAALEQLLALGVQRAVVGSVAVSRPAEVREWLLEFGADRLVLALDVRLNEDGVPRLTTHGWERQTEQTLWDTVDRFMDCGLRHVLCTDVARDGALSGPNLGLYAEAVRRYPTQQWQASGGVRDAGDLVALAETGVAAVISGRALLEGRIQPGEAGPFLQGE